MPYSRKPWFMLVISGIKFTFVVDIGRIVDYLVHHEQKWMWEVAAKRIRE